MSKVLGKIISTNKKARHDYFIETTFEAGLVLTGTEIKSIRAGKVNLKDSFVRIENSEGYIYNMHIAEYSMGNRFNHEPTRTRKLLLNKREINKLRGSITRDGYTIVATKLYLKNGFAKLEIALAKGKQNYDKRQSLKEKDAKRQIEKSLSPKY